MTLTQLTVRADRSTKKTKVLSLMKLMMQLLLVSEIKTPNIIKAKALTSLQMIATPKWIGTIARQN